MACLDSNQWELQQSISKIDDSCVRMAVRKSVSPITKHSISPSLFVRAKIQGLSILMDAGVAFPRKVLSIRQSYQDARIRFDHIPPTKIAFGPSETGTAALFLSAAELYRPMLVADTVLLEMPLLSYGTQVLEYESSGFTIAFKELLGGVLPLELDDILNIDTGSLDYVLRLGEKTTQLTVETLVATGFLNRSDADEARQKSAVLFYALERFAEKRKSVGAIRLSPNGPAVNKPLLMVLLDSAPKQLRAQWEHLRISD